MKVSDFIISYLVKIGIRHINGMIGGAATHLFDSIYKEKNLTFHHYYHEQAAAFAATAQAKYSNMLHT